ncbi:MAG: acyltransferase [Burkholderiales bacterium]|nr:MAG: acyltransferase [Burkholderiales bacterium]
MIDRAPPTPPSGAIAAGHRAGRRDLPLRSRRTGHAAPTDARLVQAAGPSAPSLSGLAYRPDIDGLRAVAVLLVLAFHVLRGRPAGGFIGVDVFFVLSGFLITSILLRDLEAGRFSLISFYERRVRRIFPALIIVMGAGLILGWYALLPDEFARLGLHVAGGASFLSNLLLWNETGYFDRVAETKPLLHLWSLAIEEQFYIVWPLVLALAWRWRRSVPGVIATLAMASFLCGLVLTATLPALAFYLPLSRGWELMAGGLLAWVVLARPALLDRGGDLRAVLGALLLAAGVLSISASRPFPGAWALLPVAGAVLLISAGPQAWLNRRLLAHPAAVFVGRISYPLYLWHWLLLAFLNITEQGAASMRARLAAAALAVVAAWLTWRFVERPIREQSRGARTALSLVVLMALLGLAGLLAHQRLLPAHAAAQPRAAEIAEAFSWTEADNRDAACERRHPGHRFCRIDADAQPTVALVGDSHANQFFAGLATEFRARGENLLLLARPHCPPLLDITSGYASKADWCEGETSRSLRAVAQDPRIRTVILAGNWHLYVAGNRFHRHHRFQPPWRIAPDDGAPASDNAAVFVERLGRSIALLRAAGKRVVVIRQIPELDFEPRHCVMPRPVSLSQLDEDACNGVRRVDALRYLAEYAPAMEAALRPFPEVVTWDPAKVLCDGPHCRYVEDGMPLYQDDLHLSRFGSARVAAWLLERNPLPAIR